MRNETQNQETGAEVRIADFQAWVSLHPARELNRTGETAGLPANKGSAPYGQAPISDLRNQFSKSRAKIGRRPEWDMLQAIPRPLNHRQRRSLERLQEFQARGIFEKRIRKCNLTKWEGKI